KKDFTMLEESSLLAETTGWNLFLPILKGVNRSNSNWYNKEG
ncbi:MAG: hypothetical protein ACI90Q_002659, partial [Nonlabens sp.]